MKEISHIKNMLRYRTEEYAFPEKPFPLTIDSQCRCGTSCGCSVGCNYRIPIEQSVLKEYLELLK